MYLFTFWVKLYRAQRVAYWTIVVEADPTIFLRYPDHGLGGIRVIPNIPGC
jgi:hypothetical protein